MEGLPSLSGTTLEFQVHLLNFREKGILLSFILYDPAVVYCVTVKLRQYYSMIAEETVDIIHKINIGS
jgi:hypothetical protein